MTPDVSETVSQFREEMDTTVTGVTLGVLAVFVAVRFAFPNAMTKQVIPQVRGTMLDAFGWLFLTLMVLFVLFALFVIVGPWGSIRLGGPEAEPSYSYPAYLAMFFSAGIAAGIVFWAPAEALFHYGSPPPFVDAAASSPGAASGALQTVFFHWGISAWSAYVAVGLPIAYYAYNEGAPLRVSTLLRPFLGSDTADHPVAKLVDVLAVFATIGGVATSVGFVGNQFLTGIEYQWDVATSNVDVFVIIAGLTVVFTVSVITGVKRGIRRIAGVNVALFAVMALAVLLVGPTATIVTDGALAMGTYLLEFVTMSFGPLLGAGGGGWFDTWTLFYWVWWFSWAPFAGLFLASISRGRTLRTVTATGVLASALATVVWFAIISTTSLHLQTSGAADILGAVGQEGYAVAAFPMFEALPGGGLLVFLFFALIVTWIVTSADTSTLTVAILGTKPGVAPETGSRIFWGVLQGAFGFGLIVVGGGNALQSAAVITGGPFGVIALIGVVGLIWTVYDTEAAGEGTPGVESGDD